MPGWHQRGALVIQFASGLHWDVDSQDAEGR